MDIVQGRTNIVEYDINCVLGEDGLGFKGPSSLHVWDLWHTSFGFKFHSSIPWIQALSDLMLLDVNVSKTFVSVNCLN